MKRRRRGNGTSGSSGEELKTGPLPDLTPLTGSSHRRGDRPGSRPT